VHLACGGELTDIQVLQIDVDSPLLQTAPLRQDAEEFELSVGKLSKLPVGRLHVVRRWRFFGRLRLAQPNVLPSHGIGIEIVLIRLRMLVQCLHLGFIS
jgi:hypothetical protein